ncbi:MAG: HEXXH motif-containing putative peptide modification protein [Planctomycetota bacterium]
MAEEALGCPLAGDHPRAATALIEEVVCEHGAAVLERIVGLRGSAGGTGELPAELEHVLAVIGRAAQSRPIAWAPSFGPVAELALKPAAQALANADYQAVLQFVAELGSRGELSSAKIEVGQPVELRIGARRVPCSDTLEVCAPDDESRLRVDGAGLDARLIQASSVTLGLVPSTGQSIEVQLLERPQALGLECGEPQSPTHFEEASQQLREGLDLIRGYASAWEHWVLDVLREVRMVDGSDAIMRSGSDPRSPGAIRMSFPSSPVQVAEMLVHECSHQRFHLAERLGAVVNGADVALYNSPVKQCGRPLEAILLAYHAFANVLLFYRSCIESGLDDGGYCERNIDRHGPELAELLRPLRETDGLTEVGDFLWRPLAELIQ